MTSEHALIVFTSSIITIWWELRVKQPRVPARLKLPSAWNSIGPCCPVSRIFPAWSVGSKAPLPLGNPTPVGAVHVNRPLPTVGSGVVAGAVGAIVVVGVVTVAWVVGGEALELQPVIRRTQLSKITTKAT